MFQRKKISERDDRLLREKFGCGTEYDAARKRYEIGEPLAYILGEWYFYGEVYKVSCDCLIPQPDTEHLVDKLIKLLPANGRFADLCTGSGCIAISSLAHRKDSSAVAVDISDGALRLARENAGINGVSERLELKKADILKQSALGDDTFDIIVSNPPYIKTDVIKTLDSEVRAEPLIALDGGRDGLDFYRAIIGRYSKNVKKGGYMILEIGYDQAGDIKKLCDCEIFKDYGGNDRVAVIRL